MSARIRRFQAFLIVALLAGFASNISATESDGRSGKAFRQVRSINATLKSSASADLEQANAVTNNAWENQNTRSRASAGSDSQMRFTPGKAAVTAQAGDQGGPILDGNRAYDGPRIAPPADGVNATPWQSMTETAQKLLAIAGAMLMVATMLGMVAKHAPMFGHMFFMLAMFLSSLAAGLGSVITGIGIYLLAQGQTDQGKILMITGGVLTALALLSTLGDKRGMQATQEAQNATSGVSNDAVLHVNGESVLRPPNVSFPSPEDPGLVPPQPGTVTNVTTRISW